MERFTFSGVAGRQEFVLTWLVLLVGTAMSWAIAIAGLVSETGPGFVIAGAAAIAAILMAIHMYQISARRARDIGINAWFTLVLTIPYAGLAYMIFLFFANTGSFDQKD